MANFEDFIEQLKAAADLVAEVNATAGYELQPHRRGKYVYGVPTSRGGPGDSLMVDVERQSYYWFAKAGSGTGEEKGDIFNWLQHYRKMEFMEAVRHLCRVYNVPLPSEFDVEQTEESLSFRARAELWEVVAGWLSGQFLGSAAAMEYALGRGWDELTIRSTGLGFSPGGTGEVVEGLKDDLRGDLRMHGYDLRHPHVVAITGLRASREELLAWGKKWSVDVRQHDNWLKKGRIFGLLDFPRLVYVHRFRGRVEYFSCRNLEWGDDGRLVGVAGKWKSWNLPGVLVGDRRYFYNKFYSPRGEGPVVVVEGNADAITWEQWGVAAVSLNGLGANEELVEWLRRPETVYLGLDNDTAGRKGLDTVGGAVRPDCWVLEYPVGRGKGATHEGGEAEEGRDANDWLQAMVRRGLTNVEDQKKAVNKVLAEAELFALRVARQAGVTTGPQRVADIQAAGELISKLPENILSQYHTVLRKALDFGVREFDRVLRTVAGEGEEDEKARVEVTLGGVFGEWLLEYIYDPEEDKALLAYRDPTGKVGVGSEVFIDGLRYIPKPVTEFVRRRAVLLATGLGEEMGTRELVGEVEAFINRYYLLDNGHLVKIIAYYVLLTWIYDSFEALPYLRALGDYGSGKSELMKRVGYVCYRLITASGANTSATFFRTTEMYKGTVYIDEADLHDGGDMSNDIIKYLNQGAMKGNPITRMAEVVDFFGNKVLEPQPFDTFGPKLIAMREDFRDRAVSSRSLTVQVTGKSTEELMEAGIPLHIDDAFREEAAELRNLLLRWRLDHFVPHIDLGRELMDINLSARLNQVTMAIKAMGIIAGDDGLITEITGFLREYAKGEVQERSLTMQAYVVEALWELKRNAGLYEHLSIDGRTYFWMHDVRERANIILDSINEAGSVRGDEETRSFGPQLTPQGVGKYLRADLQIEVGARQGSGVPVYWDEKRMLRLGRKYGVLKGDDVVEDAGEEETEVVVEEQRYLDGLEEIR